MIVQGQVEQGSWTPGNGRINMTNSDSIREKNTDNLRRMVPKTLATDIIRVVDIVCSCVDLLCYKTRV